jgi:hypothetical protein
VWVDALDGVSGSQHGSQQVATTNLDFPVVATPLCLATRESSLSGDVSTSPMALSRHASQHIYERRKEKMDPSDVAEYKSLAATSSSASSEVASRRANSV